MSSPVISFRVSADFERIIRKYAKRYNLTVSDVITECVRLGVIEFKAEQEKRLQLSESKTSKKM
jgi:hypothetical protein